MARVKLTSDRSTYWVSTGTNTPSKYGDYRYYWKFYYEQTSDDKKNNRSKVIIEQYIQVYFTESHPDDWMASGYTYYPSSSGNIAIDGTWQTAKSNAQGTIQLGEQYNLYYQTTYTKTLTHNTDGTRSFKWQGTGFGKYTAVSTYSLPQILRPTIINDISTFNIDDGISLPVTKYVSSYYDVLKVSCGDYTKTIENFTNGISTGASVNVDITFTDAELDEIYTKIPTGETAQFTFTTTTYKDSNKSTTIGSSTKNVTGNFTILLPTVKGATYKDNISNMSNWTGDSTNQTIIKNISLVQVTIPSSMHAVANTRGATIKEYVIGDKHVEYNENGNVIDLWDLDEDGQIVPGSADVYNNKDYVTIYAVDSRGTSSLGYVKKFTKYIDYNYPAVNTKTWSLTRDDNGVSRFITTSFEGTWWQGNFGAKENTLTPVVYYRVNEGQIWTDLNEFVNGASIGYLDETLIDTTTKGVFKYDGPVMSSDTDKGFDIKNSYDMIIGFLDTFNEAAVLTVTVNYGEPAGAIYKNKMALGGPYNESLGGTQLWGDIYLNGEPLEHAEEPIVPVDYVVEQGDNYIKWNSGKLEQWHYKGVNPVAVTTGTGNVYTAQVELGDWDVAFIEPPKKFIANISWMNTSRYVWMGGPSYVDGVVQNPTETSCGTFNIFSTFSVEVYGSITIHAIGKWK